MSSKASSEGSKRQNQVDGAEKLRCHLLPVCGQSSWSEDVSHTEFIDVSEGSSSASTSRAAYVTVDSYPALSSQDFDSDGAGPIEVDGGFKLESEFEYWDDSCGRRVKATLRDILDTMGVTEAARTNAGVLEEQPELFLCGAEAALGMELGLVNSEHGIAMRLRLAEVLSRIIPSCLPDGKSSLSPEASISPKSLSLLDMMLTDEGCIKVRRAALRTCLKYYAPMPDLNDSDLRGRIRKPILVCGAAPRNGSRRTEPDCCNAYCQPQPERQHEAIHTSNCIVT